MFKFIFNYEVSISQPLLSQVYIISPFPSTLMVLHFEEHSKEKCIFMRKTLHINFDNILQFLLWFNIAVQRLHLKIIYVFFCFKDLYLQGFTKHILMQYRPLLWTKTIVRTLPASSISWVFSYFFIWSHMHYHFWLAMFLL